MKLNELYLLLHDIGPESDDSIIGREDCGHMRADVELRVPFELCGKSARTFWCRFQWWRGGTRPIASTPSVSSGNPDSSTIWSHNFLKRLFGGMKLRADR